MKGFEMSTINEKRVPTTIKLTDAQTKVLVRVKHSGESERAAYEEATASAKLKAATKLLIDIGAIEIENDELARLTEKGEELMKNESLLDDMGELTPEAEKHITSGATGTQSTIPTESFSLFKKINLIVEASEQSESELEREFSRAAEQIAKNLMHDHRELAPAINDGAEDIVSDIVARTVDPEEYEDMYFAVMGVLLDGTT
jgi:hypothetical protein